MHEVFSRGEVNKTLVQTRRYPSRYSARVRIYHANRHNVLRRPSNGTVWSEAVMPLWQNIIPLAVCFH